VESAAKRLERHVAAALKKGRATEQAAGKTTPPKGADGKFIAAKKDGNAGKSAATTAAAGEAPAASSTQPAAAPPAKPEPAAPNEPSIKRARELLTSGDIEGAFREAFGKLPQDFKIDSRKWEEHRKAVVRDRQKLEQRDAQAREAAANDRRQLEETLGAARRELGPLLEAQKLFKAGDRAGALKLAFGEDVAAFNKGLLAQHHGKNPELESLRAELRAEREAREKREAEEKAAREQATQREQITAYIEERQAELVDGDDPQLAALATRPGFMRRVFQVLQQHYDGSRTLPTKVAADMVRQEILAEFGGAFGAAPRDTAVPVESAQPGSKAASSGKAKKPATSLPQRGAAEASAPGRRRSVQEMLADYTDRARAEQGVA
jgi:hypothetical protein